MKHEVGDLDEVINDIASDRTDSNQMSMNDCATLTLKCCR